jgi:hypothetical protein
MHYDVTTAATAFRGALAMLVLLALFRWMFLPTAVDAFRQRIFALRRQLFLYMVEGHIARDERAYLMLRTSMNGLLRFAERVTLTRALLGSSSLRRYSEDYRVKWHAALDQIEDPAARRCLVHLRAQTSRAIFVHLVVISPIMWIVMAITFVGVLFSMRFRRHAAGKDGVPSASRTSQDEETCSTPPPDVVSTDAKSKVWERATRIQVQRGALSVEGIQAEAQMLGEAAVAA